MSTPDTQPAGSSPSTVPNMDQAIARLGGTFLVHVPYEGPPEALRLAVALARAGGGEVVGVGAEPFVPALGLESSGFAPAASEAALEQVPEHIASAASSFDVESRSLGGRATWRTGDAFPADVLVAESSGADWVVLIRPPKGASDASHPNITDVLLHSGVPVFLAPEEAAPLQGAHVTVAWRDTRETRLALTHAMPLLLAAERVFLVAAREDPDDGTPSGFDRAFRRLRVRGCAVESEVISGPDQSVAQALDAYADAQGSDVIVAGAYGHHRTQEYILGGVTRDLIAHASRWILFAH